MFSIPQPESKPLGELEASSSLRHEVEGMIDWEDCENCPVVYLHDKAEDVANLLTALYDGPWVLYFSNVQAND